MKSYWELEIITDDKTYDSVCNCLYINGINTILEENGVIKVYLPEDKLPLAEKIKNDLITSLSIRPSNIHLSKFDNHDWNKEWQSTIEPVYVKDKIIIYPSWKKSELENIKDRILIQIDPKMSFGTGHNESTQLILEMMTDYIDINDQYMLDYGCGTGILSIAGVKLGLNKVAAIDIDGDAIENAKENFEINNVSGNIKLYHSGINEISGSNFDVIAANISSGVLTTSLSVIYAKLKPGGKLFATGILTEDKDEFTGNLINSNFSINIVKEKNEWAGFYCTKNEKNLK
jgi:ribosomal protein L11 methyltransferase